MYLGHVGGGHVYHVVVALQPRKHALQRGMVQRTATASSVVLGHDELIVHNSANILIHGMHVLSFNKPRLGAQ
jgi:hypothetical protein